MKKRLPVLLLCALLLLSACGKKQAEPVGSISAEEMSETQPKQGAKKTGKNSKNAKETAAPKTTASPSGGKSSGGKSSPAATPTPKVESWADVQALQEQLAEVIAVNPVGNWIDKSTGAAMVIDEGFRGSILLTQKDGTNTIWTFTGKYDLERAELTESSCRTPPGCRPSMKTAAERSRPGKTASSGSTRPEIRR